MNHKFVIGMGQDHCWYEYRSIETLHDEANTELQEVKEESSTAVTSDSLQDDLLEPPSEFER